MLSNTILLLALAAPLQPSSGAPSDLPPDTVSIRLPRDPRVAPDGDSLAFTWRGDLWTASIEGGEATRMTIHPGEDRSPAFSPDGKTIYFVSNRSGWDQIHAMPSGGGAARQITFDSNPKTLLEATADGEGLLIRQGTDRGWHYSERDRLMIVPLDGDGPKRMLFDAGVRDGALSPDGQHALFCRGYSSWSRKGYQGPQAAQLWHADLTGEAPAMKRLDSDRERFQNVASMDPMWGPDGETVYFVSDPDGTFDVYAMNLTSGEISRVTRVSDADGSDDGVTFPSMSADGRTLLYRRRFDLVAHDVKSGESRELQLHAAGDAAASAIERQRIENAGSVAFTADGKQMAFVAGGDVWVMDRILKEPVRVTNTIHIERDLVFTEDGERLFYTSDASGEVEIWQATHDREDGIWWMADAFELQTVTDDEAVERGLELSPNGTHVAYVRGTDLFVMDADGTDHRRVAAMWSAPSFSWSPDGRWITYATEDDDYNSDIHIVPLDGMREPFNVSRHPDSDRGPVWSGDGKRIAWIGRRDGEEYDIYWVELTKASSETTERDELLEKALKAMEPKEGGARKGEGRGKSEGGGDSADEEEKGEEKPEGAGKPEGEEKDDVISIDFDGILNRVSRIRVPDSFESGLTWFDDGATLGFSASIDGRPGFHQVKFPRPEDPERIADSALSGMRWLPGAKEFVGLDGGKPAKMDKGGKRESFDFSVRVAKDWRELRRVAFDQAWRAMRDRFYDEAYNNRDWNRVRAKYRAVAGDCLGAAEFSHLCNMMLGELNASHMGHRGGTDPLPAFDAQNQWTPRTMHLGLRFDAASQGPGLVVESVIPGGPCSRERSHVMAGETVLSIDGVAVGPDVDLERVLTMEDERDVILAVEDRGGEVREVTVRPVASVARLLYPEWIEHTRAEVDRLSKGRLGYLHIQGMNFPSFRQMEEDLYHAGVGKDGIVIDVRFNGGGSTTDHVLTALTQPVHAITRSRGSGEGYPQDRKVYASWSKPIVLMCNEHSFSNAEILSHAIKQLGRGRLVGMRTAGGVISTGGQTLVDGSFIRMPTRGWYLVSTGEDMELNGCEPHVAFWNAPDWNAPDGADAQLEKAVELLLEDVQAKAEEAGVELVPAARLRR